VLLRANPDRIKWNLLSHNHVLFTPDPVRYRTNVDRMTKILTRM